LAQSVFLPSQLQHSYDNVLTGMTVTMQSSAAPPPSLHPLFHLLVITVYKLLCFGNVFVNKITDNDDIKYCTVV
jgi:hypothetical protein